MSSASNSQEPPFKIAVIALGSNVGDSQKNIFQAMGTLLKISSGFICRSSLWRSTPVDCPPGSPDFINAVVGISVKADETPETMLARLQKIEQEFGRKPKTVHNEPRPLDLDLITFGGEIRNTAKLTLPHPRAHQRRFVLEPMAEIFPNLVLPGQTKKISELLAELNSPEKLEKIDLRES